MKAIIYARVSPRKELDKTESIENQIDYCADFCEKHGHDIECVYTDVGKSGADINREGLWGAIDALKRNSLLVVYKFDRLARDGFIAFDVQQHALNVGANIISASGEGEITANLDPGEKFKLTIMYAFSEYERAKTAQRTSMGMKARQARLQKMSSRPPFGFKIDNNDMSRIVPNKDEQKALSIIRTMNEAGKSYGKIAMELEKKGATIGGRPKWYRTTVKRIVERLSDRLYLTV